MKRCCILSSGLAMAAAAAMMALPAGAATPGSATAGRATPLTPPVSPAPDPGHNTSQKSLKDSILPAVKKGGFDMGKDWILWCSSVIKVGDTPVIHFSNPALFVLPDNRVYVFGRYNPSSNPMGTAAIAGSYQGPYQLVASANTNLLTNGATLEDPTIWWAGNQYNVVATDIGAKATGQRAASRQMPPKGGTRRLLAAPSAHQA